MRADSCLEDGEGTGGKLVLFDLRYFIFPKYGG
jgi:hypothetical protein